MDGDPDRVELPPVQGVIESDDSLLGVFVYHPHLAHYGLASKLPKTTPILIGPAAEHKGSCYRLLNDGLNRKIWSENACFACLLDTPTADL